MRIMTSQITSPQTASSSIAILFMCKFRSISTTIIHYHSPICRHKTLCFSTSSCKLQWMLLCRGPYQILHGYIKILKWNILQITFPLQPTPPQGLLVLYAVACKGQSFLIAFILHAWRYSRLDPILLSLCPLSRIQYKGHYWWLQMWTRMCWEICSVIFHHNKVLYNRILITKLRWVW